VLGIRFKNYILDSICPIRRSVVTHLCKNRSRRG